MRGAFPDTWIREAFRYFVEAAHESDRQECKAIVKSAVRDILNNPDDYRSADFQPLYHYRAKSTLRHSLKVRFREAGLQDRVAEKLTWLALYLFDVAGRFQFGEFSQSCLQIVNASEELIKSKRTVVDLLSLIVEDYNQQVECILPLFQLAGRSRAKRYGWHATKFNTTAVGIGMLFADIRRSP